MRSITRKIAPVAGTLTRSRFIAAALITMLVPIAMPTGSAAQTGEVRRFELSIKDGKMDGGLRTVRVVRGDAVVLRWTVDQPTILHLHGYDIEIEVRPDAPREMAFEARSTGRFPVEMHGDNGEGRRAHRVLIHVEVHPR